MLRMLVPQGRTHRLSVFIAAILQYVYEVALISEQKSLDFKNYLEICENAFEDPDEGMNILIVLIESFFTDAGVQCERINSRGQEYSIAEEAAYQFINWDSMPWEG